MNRAGPAAIHIKEARVRSFLEQNDLDAMLIGRKDNFAWFTCGGNNEVVKPTEAGFAVLVITRDGARMIAHVMDGRRIIDEELNGYDLEYTPVRWYDGQLLEKAALLIRNMRVISDVFCEGATYDPRTIQNMHYPLTDMELQRLKKLGSITDRVLRSIAEEIKPGMREVDVAAMLLSEYTSRGIACDVLLIGSDERVSKYRHPVPSEKPIQRHVLLHPAICGWGLHANVTRQVYFNSVPEEIERRYDAACRIQAASIAQCVPGRRFQDILEVQKRLYEETGYADEWRNHFQGAVTGYILADPTPSLDPHACISANQAYDWFITITGVKVEELSINTGDSREVCSASGQWPTKRYSCDGQVFGLPQILVR